MSSPTPDSLFDALSATWPAEETLDDGPLTLRRSRGGGKRVSAASLRAGSVSRADLRRAERIMRDWNQTPLFMLRQDQSAFDKMLGAEGYDVLDRTVFYVAPINTLSEIPAPPVTCFDIWPPMAIMLDLWRSSGHGPDRIAVMGRASTPKTALFGRQDDQPAGVGFIAAFGDVAMLHALEICPVHRRKGLARNLTAHAARWAAAQGCRTLALAVTQANLPARAVYASLGMTAVGGYAYRSLGNTHG